jgi:hypothetical protein
VVRVETIVHATSEQKQVAGKLLVSDLVVSQQQVPAGKTPYVDSVHGQIPTPTAFRCRAGRSASCS